MREYDLITDWYGRDRGGEIGVAEVLAVVNLLPAGSVVLDVGCGNGVPITRAIETAGHSVIGLDSSREMLSRFRSNLPNTSAVACDVRSCPFANNSFDAAVSWGMMFHMTSDEQAVALSSIARVLKLGAPFLFTAAEIADADPSGITGIMNDITFRYYAVSDYRSMMADVGMVLDDVYVGPGENTYFLARKVS